MPQDTVLVLLEGLRRQATADHIVLIVVGGLYTLILAFHITRSK